MTKEEVEYQLKREQVAKRNAEKREVYWERNLKMVLAEWIKGLLVSNDHNRVIQKSTWYHICQRVLEAGKNLNHMLKRCLLLDANLDRALYNKGYRCPVEELKINLLTVLFFLTQLTPSVFQSSFPLTPRANRANFERWPSVNGFWLSFF